jgi:transposase
MVSRLIKIESKFMQSKMKSFIGIDVSKLWFDLSLIQVFDGVKREMITDKFENNPAGFRLLTKWLKSQGVSFDDNTLVVIENTGVYHRLIWQYCTEKGLSLHIGNAAAIKWSLGITRGKDDVTDSQRLCSYCYRQADELKTTPVLNPVILQLKDLMTARTRLIKQINSTKVYLNELKLSNSKGAQIILEKHHKSALDGMQKSLDLIDKEIKKIVAQNESIKHSYKLLISVPGIGPVTAITMICCTANFASRISGKQLACYAGVAPFGHQSGSSIKGKNKVHKMANKDLKKLLHMGARSVATHNTEFKNYYERKLKEGKHDLAIINAIRNKIVLRAVSVINRKEYYVDNYKKVA